MIGPPALLWEDPHGLAVAKPAGLLTQGPPDGEETLESWVRRHLRPSDPASAYLGTVHRLDRPVSGVVLWAKTPRAARRWSAEFAGRRALKEYWAIVELGGHAGRPPASGTWEDRLAPPDALGRSRVVEADEARGAGASTHFEVIEGRDSPPGTAWLRLRPSTGRTHQLRAQAASRGWPIVGDATYGSSLPFPSGIALHARSLTIEHPSTRRPIAVEAPFPGCWPARPGV